jgi:hypothetical protein
VFVVVVSVMPSPGQSALKFLRSNLRRGAKPKVRIAVMGQASVGKTGECSIRRSSIIRLIGSVCSGVKQPLHDYISRQ